MMKKPQYLVSPSQARCISSREEVERLLAMGWLLAKPKPRTKRAAELRAERARRRAEGWLSMLIWLSPEDAALVKSLKRPDEDYAAMLVRLARRSLI